MGYEFHITRRERWSHENSTPNDISLNEWLSYIDNDPELELTEGYWVKVPGSKESQPAPGFCEWNAHPLDESPWFDYSDGSISTKNPDDATIRKMLAIAEALNAQVQGDDCEVYVISRTNEAVRGPLRYGDKDDPYTEDKRPWWKFW